MVIVFVMGRKMRTFFYMIVLALAFALVTYIVFGPGKPVTTDLKLGDKLFKELNLDKISTIRIESSDGRVEIAKKEGTWRIPALKDYPVAKDKIVNYLDMIAKIKKDEVISQSKDKHDDFEVSDSTATKLTLLDDANSQLAFLYIGKTASYQSNYVRLLDAVETLMVYENIKNSSFVKPGDWIDKTVIQFDFDKVSKLSFKMQKGFGADAHNAQAPEHEDEEPEDETDSAEIEYEEFVVVKNKLDEENYGWQIASPVSVDADKSKVDSVVRKLSNFRIDNFYLVDGTFGEDTGLALSKLTAEIELTNGEKYSLSVGETKDDNRRVVAVNEEPSKPFLAFSGTVDSLKTTYTELISRKICDITPAEADVVEIRDSLNGQSVSLAKSADTNKWALTAPFAVPADTSVVNALVNLFDLFNADSVRIPEAGHTEQTVDNKITVSIRSAGNVLVELEFYSDSAADKAVVINPNGSGVEYLVPKSTLDIVNKSAYTFVEKRVQAPLVDELTGIVVDVTERFEIVKSDGGEWALAGVEDSDTSKLNVFIRKLLNIRAEAVLSFDENKMLFDSPAKQMSVLLSKNDTIQLEYILAESTEDDGGFYLKIRGENQFIYKLKKADADLLKSEVSSLQKGVE